MTHNQIQIKQIKTMEIHKDTKKINKTRFSLNQRRKHNSKNNENNNKK